MKYNLLLFAFLLFPTGYIFSQHIKQDSVYYNLYDSYLQPKNNEVFNGREYLDVYPEEIKKAITNNKYYGAYDFINGMIHYNGQKYFNVYFKYELVHDVLLLKYVNERVNLLALNPELIDGFTLMGDYFKKINNYSGINTVYRNGFFKEAFKGKIFSLYIKYIKEVKEEVTGNELKYRFRPNRFYVARYKNKYHLISTKKSLLKAFPIQEKAIRSFYKTNKVLRKKNQEQFFASLIKHLDNLGV